MIIFRLFLISLMLIQFQLVKGEEIKIGTLHGQLRFDPEIILVKRGAEQVHVYATHGVFSGDAVKKIKNSKIKNLVITDSIDSSDKLKKVRNIEVLSISILLAEAIKRISNSTSVSDLFK